MKQKSLNLLSESIAKCVKCPDLVANRTQTVFDSGNPDARIMCVAESPGKNEDEQGEVLIGKAGQLLTNILNACGWDRKKDVYLCNVIKCRPPNNRNPTQLEVNNCSEFLDEQIDLVDPKWILALGSVASRRLLGMNIGMARGQWHTYKKYPVLSTYHPSYLLRFPNEKKVVWDDLQLLIHEYKKHVA